MRTAWCRHQRLTDGSSWVTYIREAAPHLPLRAVFIHDDDAPENVRARRAVKTETRSIFETASGTKSRDLLVVWAPTRTDATAMTSWGNDMRSAHCYDGEGTKDARRPLRRRGSGQRGKFGRGSSTDYRAVERHFSCTAFIKDPEKLCWSLPGPPSKEVFELAGPNRKYGRMRPGLPWTCRPASRNRVPSSTSMRLREVLRRGGAFDQGPDEGVVKSR